MALPVEVVPYFSAAYAADSVSQAGQVWWVDFSAAYAADSDTSLRIKAARNFSAAYAADSAGRR